MGSDFFWTNSVKAMAICIKKNYIKDGHTSGRTSYHIAVRLIEPGKPDRMVYFDEEGDARRWYEIEPNRRSDGVDY